MYTKIIGLAQKWIDEVFEYDPTDVGISVFSYNSQRATILLSTMIKSRKPDIPLFMGGAGLNTDNNFGPYCLEQGIMDCWIRGEGELSVPAYLNGDMSHPGLNGIPPKQIDNIDDLEFPDYSDYELASYTNKKGLPKGSPYFKIYLLSIYTLLILQLLQQLNQLHLPHQELLLES